MTVSRQRSNRPLKYGSGDRRELIVQDSEVALRAINDTNGNVIFLGRALVGTTDAQAKWQIRKSTYDSNGSVTTVEWPLNDDNKASADYEFVWDASTAMEVTAITQANPAEVTVSSIGLAQDGDTVILQDVAGMTEVNFDGTNFYTIANSTATTFELSGIDSSTFTAYTSGGSATFGNVVNLSYS